MDNCLVNTQTRGFPIGTLPKKIVSDNTCNFIRSCNNIWWRLYVDLFETACGFVKRCMWICHKLHINLSEAGWTFFNSCILLCQKVKKHTKNAKKNKREKAACVSLLRIYFWGLIDLNKKKQAGFYRNKIKILTESVGPSRAFGLNWSFAFKLPRKMKIIMSVL